MAKSALWISCGDFADDDSLLAYAMKTRLIVASLLFACFVSSAFAEGVVPSVVTPYMASFTSFYGPGSGSGNWNCNGTSSKECLQSIVNSNFYTIEIVDPAPPNAYGRILFSWKYISTGVVTNNGYANGSGWSTQNTCPENATMTGADCVCDAEYIANGSVCDVAPPEPCAARTGTESPHLTASGTNVPSTACFESCSVSIDVGAAGSDFWVGWGQYTGADCTGGDTASIAPAPEPDVCPAGRTVYNGVCTPLVDIPELGYGGMSISDIQKAIAKSEAATAAKQTAAAAVVAPEYSSPDSVPAAPSITSSDAVAAVGAAGAAGVESARAQGGSGDTQILSGTMAEGSSSIVTTLKGIFGGNVDAATVNGIPNDLAVQPVVREIAVSQITPVAVAHAQAVCPSTNITLQGIPVVWTYTTECNFAESIRPILLAFAWLSASFILVGGIKNG